MPSSGSHKTFCRVVNVGHVFLSHIVSNFNLNSEKVLTLFSSNHTGEYSREAVQLLDVARLDPGAHQEAPAAGLE